MSDDLKAKTIRGVGWSTVQSWSVQLISFLVYPILARLLGPEAYGLIALAGVFITLLDIFLDVSFGAAIEQRKDLAPQHINAVFWAFLALGLVLTTISMFVAPTVAVFLREPDALPPIIRWFSLGFLLQMVCGVQASLLRRELRIKALTTQALVSVSAGAVVGIAMALIGFGVWALVFRVLVSRVVAVIMLWRLSSWRPQWEFSRRHFNDVAGFGLAVMGNRMLNYLNQHLDQFLVGRYLGTLALGLYDSAHRLMSLATNLLIGSYSQVAMPAFAKLQDDRPRFRAAFNKACRFITLVAFPAFVGLYALAEELIVTIIGEQWQDSAPVLRLLSLAGIIQAIQYVNGAAMMAVGRANLRLALLAIHSTGNVIGFLLAYRHGIVAVAAAYTIRAYALAPLDTWLNCRLGAVDFRGLLRAVRAQAVAAGLMALVLAYLRAEVLAAWPAPAVVACGLPVGGATYVLACLIFDRRLAGESRDLFALFFTRPKPPAGNDSESCNQRDPFEP